MGFPQYKTIVLIANKPVIYSLIEDHSKAMPRHDAIELAILKERITDNKLYLIHTQTKLNISDIVTKANADNFDANISIITGQAVTAKQFKQRTLNIIKQSYEGNAMTSDFPSFEALQTYLSHAHKLEDGFKYIPPQSPATVAVKLSNSTKRSDSGRKKQLLKS